MPLPPLQIAYQKQNPNWILPARYYNADVKSAGTSIRFHVAHTSCFVKKVPPDATWLPLPWLAFTTAP